MERFGGWHACCRLPGMFVLLVACSDYSLGRGMDSVPGWDPSWDDQPTDGAARIQVLPDPFDFGQVAINSTKDVTFNIKNLGSFLLTYFYAHQCAE